MFKRRKGQGEDVEELEVDVETVDGTRKPTTTTPRSTTTAPRDRGTSRGRRAGRHGGRTDRLRSHPGAPDPGMEVRVEIDPESNEPAAITLVHGEGAVQVRAFAAPRSGGGWQITLDELRAQISGDGRHGRRVRGSLRRRVVAAAVQGEDENGQTVVQPVRFVGVDGPRWSLQGVMFGAGADPPPRVTWRTCSGRWSSCVATPPCRQECPCRRRCPNRCLATWSSQGLPISDALC